MSILYIIFLLLISLYNLIILVVLTLLVLVTRLLYHLLFWLPIVNVTLRGLHKGLLNYFRNWKPYLPFVDSPVT